jgi:O-antigen/teichoic acid export membrane protein
MTPRMWLVRLLKPGPDDDSTEAGRAKGRQRRVLLAMTASSAARLISMATGFIAVPITLRYLGTERYGLWTVISSLSLAMNFADLGLGNSLVNTLADAHGRGDRSAAREQVSTAFFLFSGIALALLIGFWLLYPHVNWAHEFNVQSPEAAREVGPALWYFVGCLTAGLVVGISSRVELAYQNAFANGVWQAVGSVGALAALLLAMHYDVRLPGLVLMLSGVPVLAMIGQAITVFFVTRPWLRPSPAWVNRRVAASLMRLGAGYLVLQLAATLSMYSDSIIAIRILGPTAVTQFGVVSRPFAVLSATLFMALVPMWPAYTEALAQGDVAWVRQTLKRSLGLVAIVVGVPSLLLVLVGGPLIRLWVRNPSFEVPAALLIALAVWTLIQGVSGAWATLMNGLSIVRFQAVCAVLTAVVAVGAKILLAQRAGIPGLVWGTSLAHLVFTLVPIGLYMRYSLARRSAAGGMAAPVTTGPLPPL